MNIKLEREVQKVKQKHQNYQNLNTIHWIQNHRELEQKRKQTDL